MYNIRIYNGVNHNINLYENQANFTVNRKGQYFLTSPNAKPDRIIRQMKPMSVKTDLIPTNPMTSPGLFLPEAVGAQIETLPNYNDFDIVVVSTIYAGMARQLIVNNPDYLDRLYTPVPVFDDDPQVYRNSARMTGSIGFRKVWCPMAPQWYVVEFRNGRLPSVASARVCLDIYSHRPYCDTNTAAWLTELKNWLPSDAVNRNLSVMGR